MGITLNGTWVIGKPYLQDWHSVAVAIGGPVFSILMASIGLVVIEKTRNMYAFPFLFFPLYSRAFALILGGFSRQDEAGISEALKLGKYTVATFVCSVLLILVWRGSAKLRFGFEHNMTCFLISTVVELIVIGASKAFI
jgi:hypothetical protein